MLFSSHELISILLIGRYKDIQMRNFLIFFSFATKIIKILLLLLYNGILIILFRIINILILL